MKVTVTMAGREYGEYRLAILLAFALIAGALTILGREACLPLKKGPDVRFAKERLKLKQTLDSAAL